jgi:serine/threonine protein kinase
MPVSWVSDIESAVFVCRIFSDCIERFRWSNAMVGKTLGHYQITCQPGKGGMGEVYQAKDRKLGRDVAIKVLPDEFAKDADRVARFQREAAIAGLLLRHPRFNRKEDAHSVKCGQQPGLRRGGSNALTVLGACLLLVF